MSHPITETIGLDLGDKHCAYCILDQKSGEVLDRGSIRTTPAGVRGFFTEHPGARVILETGTPLAVDQPSCFDAVSRGVRRQCTRGRHHLEADPQVGS